MPYGVHLIPSCSAFNKGCSTVEKKMKMVPLLNVATELLGQNKVIFDDQPAYD